MRACSRRGVHESLPAAPGRAADRVAAPADAAYGTGTVVDGGVGGTNRALRGNHVEGVPRWIVRSGLTASGAVEGARCD